MTPTSDQPAISKPRSDAAPAAVSPALPGESAVIWTLWLTYGAFYFCRNNLSVAAPGLKAALDAGGLALTGEQVGWILASSKIAYGLGQFLNGQLSERIPPRVMLALGLFGSAALNVLFGLSEGFFFLLFVWATNGFCQSLGWTPCMRVVANWVPVSRRGNAIGIIGTGYQITQGLTFLIAGQAAAHLGWRGAMYVPAGLLALTGLFMLVCLREAPAEISHSSPGAAAQQMRAADQLSLAGNLYWTLYNPALWLLGLALGLLNACRFGFLDWGVTHLMETKELRVDKATLQFFVIAIGATAGSYLAGWATDRYFGSRRAPVVCLLMAVLGGLTLIYDRIVHASPTGTMLLLVVIGFCIFGPQVLLVGTAPADLAHRGTSAAAAGFVNFMGYMGAATGDVVTGYYSSPQHGGWQFAIYLWAGWAFAGAAIMALLWNTTARRLTLVPGIFPKLAALAMLLLAGFAAVRGGQPLALQVATFAAAACLLAAFVTRWAALVAMLVAGAGALTVFLLYARVGGTVTWPQATALVAYGLTIILTLMILVEQKVEPKGDVCESL